MDQAVMCVYGDVVLGPASVCAALGAFTVWLSGTPPVGLAPGLAATRSGLSTTSWMVRSSRRPPAQRNGCGAC
jgi:hypothetical protein